MFGGKTEYNPLNSPTQPVTATPTAHWATSVTQLQASVSADKEPPGGSALTVSRASGASPAAPPVSVTAMQTSAIPARENAEAAGTSQQDISVSGKENSVPYFTLQLLCPSDQIESKSFISFCSSCMDTFFGNPALGSGQHCRPCPCPNNPNSDNFNALSCQVDHTSDQIMCNCKQGYMGEHWFILVHSSMFDWQHCAVK